MTGKKYDRFEPQKKHIRRKRNWYIFTAVISLVWLLMFLGVLSGVILVLLAGIALALMIFSVYNIISCAGQIKQFSKITLGETYLVETYRPKIRLLYYTHYKSTHRGVQIFYGVVITDEKKNKYIYYFGEGYAFEKEDIQKIQAKFENVIHLSCYQNTNIIQVIEDDPHFLKTRARYDYE